MKLGFFDWIREGVRQSVLLGLADAASHIAAPEEVEQLNERFLATIEQRSIEHQNEQKGSRRRKALGRSLSQIVDET